VEEEELALLSAKLLTIGVKMCRSFYCPLPRRNRILRLLASWGVKIETGETDDRSDEERFHDTVQNPSRKHVLYLSIVL
jgi:hypothetical protein